MKALNYTELCILIWVTWGVCFVLTLARGYTRFLRQKKFWADDYTTFGAFLCLTGLTAVITKMMPQFYVAGDFMKKLNDPSQASTMGPINLNEMMAQTAESLKLMFSLMILFFTGLFLAKLSLLFFFRRLILGLPRYIRVWWVLFVIVVLFWVGSVITNFITCRPLSKYWSGFGCSSPEERKISDKSIRFATGADVATDILIMLLPLHLLRKLKITTRQKLGLGLMFSIGFIIIAFAIARLIFVTKATTDMSNDLTAVANSPSFLSTWSHMEVAVAVVVANLPAFRYLLSTAAGRRRTDGQYEDSKGPYNRGYHKATPAGGHTGGKPGESVQQGAAGNGLAAVHKATGKRSGSTTIATLDGDEYGSTNELNTTDGITKHVDYTVSEQVIELEPVKTDDGRATGGNCNNDPAIDGFRRDYNGKMFYSSHDPVPKDERTTTTSGASSKRGWEVV